MGSYEVDSYKWSIIPDITLMLYINYGLTVVVVNNKACPTCLSLMPEATCSIELLISCALMPKVTEIVTCLAFKSHLPNEPLLSSGHP